LYVGRRGFSIFTVSGTSEEEIHQSIVQHLEYSDLEFTHYPAGGKRPWYSSKKMKKMGAKSGYPDFYIANPCPDPPPWSGNLPTWIELKRPDGKLSDNQFQRIRILEFLNHPVFVAFGFEDFFEKLEWCGYDLGGIQWR
jgi:hypothetical protein